MPKLDAKMVFFNRAMTTGECYCYYLVYRVSEPPSTTT